ncbi:MAG: glycoside hydrolase family 3 C-terminal domain-containing protein [Bacteroides sp.]|nr:glycoside hydrolase family 3 C-terminal domain-containing protein [Bacteroides sp.]
MPLAKSVIDRKAAENDIAILSLGRSSGEGTDRQLKGDYLLSENEQQLIQQVSQAFHGKGKKVIVILNTGGVMDVESWKNQADAILLAWQPAQEGGNAIADILTGSVTPSGKLTMTFPVRYEDVPSAAHFPKPGENPEYIEYTDGIYVGYRYFSSFDVQPAYPFGYGLSYTQFDYSPVKVEEVAATGEKEISFQVKNTGSVPGKEVVQLYVSSPAGLIDKPVKELKAFVKTGLLSPGEEEEIRFRLSVADLASFVPEDSAWIAEAGVYTIEAGTSSQDIKQVSTFTLPENQVVTKVHNILNPDQPIHELKN